MRNASKKSWRVIFKTAFMLTLLVPVSSGFSVPVSPGHSIPASVYLTCDPPSPSVTERSSNSVSFAWLAVSSASGYRVWYHRAEDNYTSPVTTTGTNAISYSDLLAGTYDFYFVTVCGEQHSQSIIIDDLMMG